ncbi:MAG: hypothetical protein N3A61_03190, partial [Ignavibacteria bacterium]|nr:hypothetical protein [Ignavibacteria bacterium]
DINDGRQSFGIQNTLSFIQEGMNAENYTTDNIERRAKSQMLGMLGLLKFCYENKDEIKNLVEQERKKLIQNEVKNKVAIQLEHISDGKEIELKLLSYNSGEDTIVAVKDFRPIVSSIYNVTRPKGYLIPKSIPELKIWMENHNLIHSEASLNQINRVEEYLIDSIGKIDFERDTIINPFVSIRDISHKINLDEYYYLPLNQLKNNMIVIALEPKSMLGLITYKQFEYLLVKGATFPILRVLD